MNRFEIDFDGLRAQALDTTLLNDRPSGHTSDNARDQSMIARVARALQTIASLWNRRQHPLPEHLARSRERMINAAQL